MALNLKDYEYSYRSLNFGADTEYPLSKESGILSCEVRSGDRDNPRGHGSVPGIHMAARKYIELEIEVVGRYGYPQYVNHVEFVCRVFNPEQYKKADEIYDKLFFKYPGFPESFVLARPIKRTIIRTPRTEMGVLPIAIQMLQYDPRRYVNDYVDSGWVTGTITVENDSPITVYPFLELRTSATSAGVAKITNNTTGDVFEVAGAGNNQVVYARMDILERSVFGMIVYSGSVDLYSKWVAPRLPFTLLPGTNSITLNSGQKFRVRHRTCYL
jgi:hypothetical protein